MIKNEPVALCYASDENYAPHMTVSIYSLMCNADKSRQYEIIILHSVIINTKNNYRG